MLLINRFLNNVYGSKFHREDSGADIRCVRQHKYLRARQLGANLSKDAKTKTALYLKIDEEDIRVCSAMDSMSQSNARATLIDEASFLVSN